MRENLAEDPIPEPTSGLANWKNRRIVENGERLVAVSELPDRNRVQVRLRYHEQGVSGAPSLCLVRESVAALLVAASRRLPNGLSLVIWDAWRPIQVQESLYESFLAQLRTDKPYLSDSELKDLAAQYVSIPSRNMAEPPPHLTGGAIDLSIVDENGDSLNMGTAYDDFSDKANTRYFEQKLLSDTGAPDDYECLRNRRILYHCLTRVGFTNYPREWWHFDYGNQFWATLSGRETAIYGACFPRSDEVS